MLWRLSKWFLFPSSCWKYTGNFLQYLLWEPGGAPVGKSHKFVGPPWLGPPEDFNSQSCLHGASSTWSITVQVFLAQVWFRQWFPLRSLCSGKLTSLFACLSNLRHCGLPCSYLSYGSEKSCQFFSLFSFLLVRVKSWFPSSLHAELKIQSPKITLLYTCVDKIAFSVC